MKERGSLSPFLLIRNAVKISESTIFGRPPISSSFNFNGRLAANNGGVCVTFATDV